MMLEHLDQEEVAARIRAAVDQVLAEGTVRTPDLGGSSTSAQYTQAIIDHLHYVLSPVFSAGDFSFLAKTFRGFPSVLGKMYLAPAGKS